MFMTLMFPSLYVKQRHLSTTYTGKPILHHLRIGITTMVESEASLPWDIHECLQIRPFSCKIHPVHLVERRCQCTLTGKMPISPNGMHAYASEHQHTSGFAVAVVTHPNSPPVTSLTFRTAYPKKKHATTREAHWTSPSVYRQRAPSQREVTRDTHTVFVFAHVSTVTHRDSLFQELCIFLLVLI